MNYIFPIVFCGFTAWFISYISIKTLFHPVKPIKLFGFKLQGIVPQQQEQLAARIGNTIAKEFFSFPEIQSRLSDPAILERLKPVIEEHVDLFLEEKIAVVFPMISKLIGEKTKRQFKEAFMDEIETLFPTLLSKYVAELEHKLDFGKLVTAKISSVSVEKLRTIFYKNFGHKLLRFQLLCTLSGLFIGILQVILLVSV